MLRSAITAAPNTTCSPTTSTTTTWVQTTSPAATRTCPTADQPTGKHPRLQRPVRPIPQTHKGKLTPSLTIHFRVRLAALGSTHPDVPGRALGYLDGVDAGLDRVSRTPQPALLKDGGRLASSLGAPGEGPGRFSLNVIGKPRPGNVRRRAEFLDNGTLRVHIQPPVSARRGGEAVQAPTTRHTQGNSSCGRRFANSAAISRRPGPGGFCTLAGMAVSSLMVPLGTPAPDFALPDLAGATRPARRLRRGTCAAGHVPVQSLSVRASHRGRAEQAASAVPSLAVVGSAPTTSRPIQTTDPSAWPSRPAVPAGSSRTWSTTTNRSVVPTTQPARPTSSCTTDSAGWHTAARSTNHARQRQAGNRRPAARRSGAGARRQAGA